MTDFKIFMKPNALPAQTEKYIASTRFVGEDGKPAAWEIQAITSEEDEAIRKSCTKKVPIHGKGNQFTVETDYNKYLGLLAVRCTVFPDLENSELQDSYGVMGADKLLKTMLLPGEYANYLSQIQQINRFDITTEELVDEVKN